MGGMVTDCKLGGVLMRGLNQQFMDDLKTGCLSCFLRLVKENDELCIAIRDNYINIYYKGGNALRIRQRKNGYKFEFNANYCMDEQTRAEVSALNTLDDYKNNFSRCLSVMDRWFDKHPKGERKIQQELIKHNTQDFCVLDIEYVACIDIAGKRKLPQFDMIAVFDGKLVIVENKVGEGAIGGKAGLAKHYNDMCSLIDSAEAKRNFIQSMRNIAGNKRALGLPTADITAEEIELLFLVFNPNPKSKMIDKHIVGIDKKHPAKIIFIDGPACKIDYGTAKVFI